jgi:hypothetical protein
MPLTIAHPAAIVPLFRRMKKYGELSALIIGSMAPDFTYFLFLPISRAQTHSFAGLFWFCLPMGLFAYFVFHGLLRRPLLSLLPVQFALRLEPNNEEKKLHAWNSNLLPLCVSILTGAATHLLWDSFTHEYDFAAQTFPFLQTRLFTLFGYNVLLYKALQHGSSVVGISLLIFWTIQWFQRAAVSKRPIETATLPFRQRAFWVIFFAFAGVFAGIINGYYLSLQETGVAALREFLRGILVTGSSAIGGLLLVFSIVYQVFGLKEKRQVE